MSPKGNNHSNIGFNKLDYQIIEFFKKILHLLWMSSKGNNHYNISFLIKSIMKYYILKKNSYLHIQWSEVLFLVLNTFRIIFIVYITISFYEKLFKTYKQ